MPYLRFAATSASPSPTSSATSSPTHYAHAPCGVRSGYKSPFHEPLRVQTAFGQLEQDAQGNRSAFAGVDLASAHGRVVHAAQAGHVAYYFTFGTFGKSAVVTAKGGEQTLYTPLEWTKPPKPHRVEAGAPIGVSAGITLHYEATDGSGLHGGTKAQLNPCGDTDGAGGTIAAIGITAAISATFSSLGLDGTTIQQSSTGIVTPANISVTQVVPTHVPTYAPYEYSPTDGSYYVVLCGNVVFASGPARYAGPIPFVPNSPTPGPSPTPTPSSTASPSASPSSTPATQSFARGTPTPSPTPSPTASPTPAPSTIPNLVFFRDAGAYGSDLVAPLPVYGNPCPAPAPPSGGGFYPVFDWIGQTAWGYWFNTGSSGETMAMVVASPGIASVNPSAAPVLPSEVTLPYPPPPGDIFTINAVGVGTTTISNTNSGCSCTASPIPVTVKATPSPAPVPPPIPNATSSP